MNRLRIRRPIVAAAAGIALALLLFVVWVFWWPNPSATPQGTVVSIPRGSTFRAAVDSLVVSGAIGNRWSFTVAARLMGADRKIHVGRYLFRPGMSNRAILADLSSGASRVLVSVVLPEGWRMSLVARRFTRALGGDSTAFMRLCTDPAFVHALGIDAENLEGYLLPDTYEFYWQTDEEEIVRTLVASFKAFYVDSLAERQRELGLSIRQVLALASIVEGEAVIDSERAVIAGVYWNRLHKRMRLEADPTIQYLLPDGPRRLSFADLRMDSPYNTYRFYGLPPGPINCPGRSSIIAALYPARHSYLFFVATGYGGHRFSSTYAEHQRAVRTFRKTRRLMQASAAASSGR